MEIEGSSTTAGVAGVTGTASLFDGVKGVSTSNAHAGVSGTNDNSGVWGVWGSSKQGIGVFGQSQSSQGAGVSGLNNNGGPGVLGTASDWDGVKGVSTSNAHAGVSGTNDNSGAWGVWGSSKQGDGVFGQSQSNQRSGVTGINTAGGTGVRAVGGGAQADDLPHDFANFDWNGTAAGVVALGGPEIGVYGEGDRFGVFGYSVNGQAGLFWSQSGPALWVSGGDVAAEFDGTVDVWGMSIKSGGGFKIDHPVDPENKYLCHSFVESPDMLNVYNGNVTTDASGSAMITLPDYFEALNQDFRYQLTVIGQFAQAIVAEEIRKNQFVIKTDKPNVRVSWQVTGVRKDPFANMSRIVVEEDKPVAERGLYRHPEAHGKPKRQGIRSLHMERGSLA
jgi:hypothetical protein